MIMLWGIYRAMSYSFFERGSPQPLHQNDVYSLLLFQLFNKSQQKALHRSYKPEPPNKGVKSTTKLVQKLEE
jgi:hypothetical protein